MDDPAFVDFILKAIMGTPIWVWFVFAYLLFIGFKAMKSHDVLLPKLFIIPVVLTGFKYQIFLNANLPIFFCYFLGLGVSMFFGWKEAGREKVKPIKGKLKIKLPGNYATMVILMTFFCIQYIFGYLHAANQEFSEGLRLIEIGVSGVFSGYLLGRAMNYASQYIAVLK